MKRAKLTAEDFEGLVTTERPKSGPEIKVTRVFVETQACRTRVVALRGGARSSKSYSLGQMLMMKFLKETNKKFLIVRKSLPSLRVSTLMLWNELMEEFQVTDRIKVEKVGLNYYYGTNYVHFGSIDDIEKIKSTEWNYIWMEEGTEFEHAEFLQLKTRLSAPTKDGNPNQLFISFNPIDENHWVKTKVIDQGGDVTEIVSTYHDNPFLSADYIEILEDLARQDINFYRVYCLGEWGRLDHIIYSNWETISLFPDTSEFIYGLDFGYNVASALSKISLFNKELNVDELLHKPKLTNPDLIKELKRLIPEDCRNAQHPIYGDCAEPARIEEINRAGFVCLPADKSVKDGIDFCKSFPIKITKRSTNILTEIAGYSWRTDKNKHVLDEPVKYADHGLDSMRYGAYTHYKGVAEVRIRWLR